MYILYTYTCIYTYIHTYTKGAYIDPIAHPRTTALLQRARLPGTNFSDFVFADYQVRSPTENLKQCRNSVKSFKILKRMRISEKVQKF
jgi:hypothetical protein